MKKISQIAVINFPFFYTLEQIVMKLMGFGLMLVPAFITRYLMDSRIEQGEKIPLYWFGIAIVVTAAIHLFNFYFMHYRSQMFTNQRASDFNSVIARKIASSRMPEYEAEPKSKIYNIMNSDIASIYTLSNYIVGVPVNIIKAIMVMWLLFDAHYGFALIVLVMAPLYALSSYTNQGQRKKLMEEERKAADIWLEGVEVMINSKVSIGLNRAFPYILERSEREKDAFYRARNRQHFYLLITLELPRMISTLSLLLILIVGGNMVVGGWLTLGTLVFVTQLIGYEFESLAELASLQANFLNELPIFQRGKDFVALPDGDSAPAAQMGGRQDVEDGHPAAGKGNHAEEGNLMPKKSENGQGHGQAAGDAGIISLKDAGILRPDGSRLIQIDDFFVEGPGLILIRGENGCGKSTLFNILSGVFSEKQLETGEGGSCEISSMYRDSLGYLFYPNFIFAGTVKENVLYGRDIPEREFERVHKLLNLPPADKEVRIRPENLSLGEKQKIYLARLLLGDYKCILLDEPGSNLDDRTEENLIQALGEMKCGRLLLVISHNDRYDRIADRIYTVKDGSMAAD